MIKVSVLYPSKPGGHFDVDYYLNVHVPLAVKLLGHALRGVNVEIGISGASPDQPAAYPAIAAFLCDSIDGFAQAFTPVATQLLDDIPNYTNIEPVIQFSQVHEFVLAQA